MQLTAERPRLLQIALVDDEARDREKLTKALKSFFSSGEALPPCTVTAYANGEALLHDFTPGQFQLVFLDIQMEGLNGIALARSLRELDASLLIVFLTSSKEYAFEAFPVHPFDYLIKPFSEDSLHALLYEALRVLDTPERTLDVRTQYGALSLPFHTICAALSQGHNVELHLSDGQHLICYTTFSELSAALSTDPRFLPCNRGIFVNMDHISSLTEDVLLTKDGTRYPLRVRNRAALISQFSQYMLSRMEREGGRP